MTDLYETLGVAKNASPDEIKKAFRKLAKSAHPDAGGKEEKFKEVSRAYAVLMKPDARDKYDRTGVIDDGVDKTEELALAIIRDLLDQAMEKSIDDPNLNVVLVMRASMVHRIGEIQQQLATMRNDVVKLTKFAERFQRKKGNNLLRDLGVQRVQNFEATIASGEAAIVTIKAAQVIMKDYDFEMPPPPATTMRTTSIFANHPMYTGTTTT